MISLFLMTRKGYLILTELIETFGKSIIDTVVCERDSNVQKDYYDEVQTLCKDLGIKFYNRKDQFTITSSHSIIISWRWLIHNSNSRLIVVHDSLLPRYRGFNPLVTALLNGDDKVGVTALYANEEYDSGDIIYQSHIDVVYPIKIETAIEQVVHCYTDAIKKVCNDLINGRTLPCIKQDDNIATYSLWRDEKDYEIDWNQSATYIRRFIDSLGFPYKGAKTYVNGKAIRILDAEVDQDLVIANRTAGKVIYVRNNIPYVVCGTGILKLTNMVDDDNAPVVINRTRVKFE